MAVAFMIHDETRGESGIFNTPPEVDLRGLKRRPTEPSWAALTGASPGENNIHAQAIHVMLEAEDHDCQLCTRNPFVR